MGVKTQMSQKMLSFFSKIKTFLFEKIDPVLLVFLLLMLNARLGLNILAIVVIYIIRPNFKIKKSGITYFYSLIILLSFFTFLVIKRDYSSAHILTVMASSTLWLFSLLSFHQIWLAVKKNTLEKTISTLQTLTIINFIVSFYDLIKIMIERKVINPYTENAPPPYGINTGDLVSGLWGGNHDINSIICAMLFIFFVCRRDFKYALLALIPHLLTGNNFILILLIFFLLFVLLAFKGKIIKYYSLFFLSIILVFYVKITPPNYFYMTNKLHLGNKASYDYFLEVAEKKNESLKNKEEINKLRKEWNLVQDPPQNANQTHPNNNKITEISKVRAALDEIEQKKLLDERNNMLHIRDSILDVKNQQVSTGMKRYNFDSIQGKIISFKQTKAFLFANWKNFLFGNGAGGFSSRIAFTNSKLMGKETRFLSWLPDYQTKEFISNHKSIYQDILLKDTSYNSVSNKPFSFYNEILGEYGFIGLLIWIICYLGFFITRWRSLNSGKYLIGMLLPILLTDYWYQSLTIVIMLEFLVLIELKINQNSKTFS